MKIKEFNNPLRRFLKKKSNIGIFFSHFNCKFIFFSLAIDLPQEFPTPARTSSWRQ
jgi:hypothetical protein